MKGEKCSKCGSVWFSPADRRFIELYGYCYDCGVDYMEEGKITELELDNQMRIAIKRAQKYG